MEPRGGAGGGAGRDGGGIQGRSVEQCRRRWLVHLQPAALGEKLVSPAEQLSSWTMNEAVLLCSAPVTLVVMYSGVVYRGVVLYCMEVLQYVDACVMTCLLQSYDKRTH